VNGARQHRGNTTSLVSERVVARVGLGGRRSGILPRLMA